MPNARFRSWLRRRWAWIGLIAVLLGVAASRIDVTVTGPRVYVRWDASVGPEQRLALERRYDLRSGEPDRQSAETWQYELGTRSESNLRALLADPAVLDTHNIDRDALTVPAASVGVSIRPLALPSLPGLPFPFSTTDEFRNPWNLLQRQSLWLLLAGGAILWAAGRAALRQRRAIAVTAFLLVGVAGCRFPISGDVVRMGDADQFVQNRPFFEIRAGVRGVLFEAHLSYATLAQIDRVLGRTQESPRQALVLLARAGTLAFVLFGLLVGALERWSPQSLRYLGLALVAPCALLFLGWREFGYLSLNVAAFPLIVRGLRDNSARLEAGALLAGLGAALHGLGLVSLAGVGLAALVAPAPPAARAGRVLRAAAWGTAGYVGWLPIYVIVLKLPILLGHAEVLPWRPLFEDQVLFARVNPAIFSATGARILLMTAWVVGVPLLPVAASLWREHRGDVRTAMAYAVPSCLATVFIWHTQGPHEDMDVVFAVFPAIYALIWVCAQDRLRTMVAAGLLVSAHLAFWRIVLDPGFRSLPAPGS